MKGRTILLLVAMGAALDERHRLHLRQGGQRPYQSVSPDETFYCVAELSNAPDDTTVRALWTAVDVEGAKPNTKIDEVSTTGGSGQLQFDLTNDSPWPVGEYKVDLFLNDQQEPTRTLEFEVQ